MKLVKDGKKVARTEDGGRYDDENDASKRRRKKGINL